ncbi:MAG TPA: DUF4870 domain-containing protein [Dehalococcoidia bacterium]|jgi:uncharacterized membrane protein
MAKISTGKASPGKTSTGLDENVAGLLCYVAWWISGIVFYLLEPDNKFVRFHALQSIFAFGPITGALIVIASASWIPILGWLLGAVGIIILIIAVIAWIICMVKAWQGHMFKLPWAGDLAEKNLKPAKK